MLKMAFKYLNDYYKAEDVASIYGIERMEIKHSNYLRWLLQPKENDCLSYYPIRQLLKTIQDNVALDNKEYAFFLDEDLDIMELSNVQVTREEHNIDLLITLEMNKPLEMKQKYVIVVENKIEASERPNQLLDYRNIINEKYSDEYKKLFVLLHPNYEQLKQFDKKEELKKSAIEQNYISITYQDLYDNVLKEYAQLVNNIEIKFMIYQYIHTLSCFSSIKLNGLIITDMERKNLEELFGNTKMKEFLSYVALRTQEPFKLYQEHKEEFNILFEKYKVLINFDDTDDVMQSINKILGKRVYILNGQEYNSIYTFVYAVLKDLVDNKNITTLDGFGDKLKERLTVDKDWFIHERFDGIENVWGGIIDTPIRIGNTDYYCAKYISYQALVGLCDLIFEEFPDYKGDYYYTIDEEGKEIRCIKGKILI